MRTSKILILIALALVIFGSAAFFGYVLFLKPSGYSIFHRKTDSMNPVVAPTPDPGIAGFDAAVALQNSGKLIEAQTAWLSWLENYSKSPKQPEAVAFLGKLNMDILCSVASPSNKESYTVVRGDSLARIASRQKSDAELIYSINRLPNINLQIGEVLLIPKLEISVDIDHEAHLLTLRNHDQFLKSYTLLGAPSAGSSKNPIQTIVIDKLAINEGKRAAFGTKKYADSERTIILRSAGNIVTAPVKEVASTKEGPTHTPANTNNEVLSNQPYTVATRELPSGYVLSAADINEIYPLISKSTPVTIH